jgi:hypothetical protein
MGFLYRGLRQISRKGTALFWVRLSSNLEERTSQLLRGGSLKARVSRKALKMEHIFIYRGFVKVTRMDSYYTADSERHITEGSGNEAFLFTGAP